MILATHVIISCYGFWLPNDPRGSWSDFVRSWELFRYGPATKVSTRESVASAPHDYALRMAAKEALLYPPVIFDGLQARAVARGFAEMVAKAGYIIYACAILPEHVHLVIAPFRYGVMQVVNLLKGAATRQLQSEGIHPLREHPREDRSLPSPWARKAWKVYIDDLDHLRAAIKYVEKNPEKEGKAPQKWNFVTVREG